MTACVCLGSGCAEDPTLEITKISEGLHSSRQRAAFSPTFTADGSAVLFANWDPRLDKGGGYVLYDVESGTRRRVAEHETSVYEVVDKQVAVISPDGQDVYYESIYGRLSLGVSVYRTNLATAETEGINVPKDPEQEPYGRFPSISDDGRFLMMLSSPTVLAEWEPRHSLEALPIRFDLWTGETKLGGRSSAYPVARESYVSIPKISGDGMYTLYAIIERTNGDGGPYHLLLYDIEADTGTFIGTLGRDNETRGWISWDFSADASVVAFTTTAPHVEEDWGRSVDVYLYYRKTGRYERFETTTDGRPLDGWCASPRVSSDGRYVTMTCMADNLGTGPTLEPDLFLWDRVCDRVARISRGDSGNGDGPSGRGDISADGSLIVFTSRAANLDPPDDQDLDVFLATNPLPRDCD